MQNYIKVLIIVTIIGGYFFFTLNKTEKFTNEIHEKLIDFMKLDTTFQEYLDFLVSIENASYDLLDQETFYNLKFLLKTQGSLSSEDISKVSSLPVMESV